MTSAARPAWIAPSILSADFSRLADEAAAVDGIEAAVVVGAESVEIDGFRSLAGGGVPVYVCTPAGAVTDTVLT